MSFLSKLFSSNQKKYQLRPGYSPADPLVIQRSTNVLGVLIWLTNREMPEVTDSHLNVIGKLVASFFGECLGQQMSDDEGLKAYLSAEKSINQIMHEAKEEGEDADQVVFSMAVDCSEDISRKLTEDLLSYVMSYHFYETSSYGRKHRNEDWIHRRIEVLSKFHSSAGRFPREPSQEEVKNISEKATELSFRVLGARKV